MRVAKKIILIGLVFSLFLFTSQSVVGAKPWSVAECEQNTGATCTKAQCDSNETNLGACQESSISPVLACCSSQTNVINSNLSNTSTGPQAGCAAESINTAIGCIPVGNLSDFAGFLLKWGVGIGGGVAFLLIVISGFMIMTASGNPERLQAGKELMTSAIMGLIMLIFSVFLLKIIGVDILQLPGIT